MISQHHFYSLLLFSRSAIKFKLSPTCSVNIFFRSHEVVSRCRNSQLQVGENYSYFFNMTANIFKP